MKTDRLIIISFILIAFGALGTHWDGTAGFSFAYPLAGCNFNFSMTRTGAAALISFVCTAAGLILFFVSFVGAILNTFSGRK